MTRLTFEIMFELVNFVRPRYGAVYATTYVRYIVHNGDARVATSTDGGFPSPDGATRAYTYTRRVL